MADLPNPLQQIQKPESAAPQAAEPAYFVMPAEYRHGALGKKMVQPKVEPPKVLTVTPPPPPPKPVVPSAGVPQKKRMAGHTKAILIAGAILLLALAIGGFLVLNSIKTPTVSTPEKPTPTTRPAPVTETTKPVETTKPPAVTETPPAVNPFPSANTPGTDSDSDGLTDLEEKLIYGTNAKLPDTDSDGFLDGNEVYHRYNPGGTAPGTLLESGLVKQYTGPAGDAPWYHVLYPAVWTVPATGTDWGIPTAFAATTGEKLTVTVLERSQGVTFAGWLQSVDPKTTFSSSTTKNGYEARTSDDQLTVYVDGSAVSAIGAGYAIKFQYDAGSKNTIDYLQTFKMMVNSLEWL